MTQQIGFLVHPGEQAATESAIAHAVACGYGVWTAVADAETRIEEQAASTVLLVTVGGDGTLLYGARLAAPRNIPVLGINRGRLGFLTDIEVPHIPACLDAFQAGRCHLQRRAMVSVSVSSRAPVEPVLALNDVAVKAHGVNLVRLSVDADDERFGEFDADGMVVATATGSTAYALSAGGPPIDPRVRALVVVPLAPHAVITRPVVLPEMTTVRVGVIHGTVFAAADGQLLGILGDGDEITVAPGPELSMVRFADSPTFLRRLHDKVRFGMPLKPLDHRPPEGPAPLEVP
ncbi:MAG: NAD(+)/NADH kinase [Candidatus Dormibacteria bacterium]